MASEEVAAQGTNAVETARVQRINVGTRLADLRSGAKGISLQGLALNTDGKTLPGTMLAGLLPFRLSSDLASADGAGSSAQRAGSSGVSAATPSAFERLGIFVNGSFTLGDKDTTSKEAGFDFDTLGVTAGIDYRFTDNFVLGVAFGFASTDADIDPSGGGGKLDAKEYSFSIYGTHYIRNFYIDGIASVGWNTFDSTRNIVYSIPGLDNNLTPTGQPTIVNQAASADIDGTHYSLGMGAGYDFHRGGLTYGPHGRVTYFKLDIDRYRERIDNANSGFGLALEVEDQNEESLTTALGGQASYAISTGLGVLVPQVLFEWVHEFLDNSRPTIARFVSDPNKVPINLTTDDPDRNFFNLGLGVSAVFRGGRSAFLYYQTALSLRDVTKHDIVLGVRLAF